MTILWFLLGVGAGIGIGCLGVCIFIDVWKNKQSAKETEARKQKCKN